MLTRLIGKSIDSAKMKCAFVIKNLKTGEYASDHETEIAPSASLIKIPVAAAILRRVKEGKLSLKHKIPVLEEEKVPSSILTLLDTGNCYSIHDLLTLMIIQSDNTAANILIDKAGIPEINRLMNGLNLKNTVLQRKMMDFLARQAGRDNLTTAQDMARLLELLYRGEMLDHEISAYLIEIMKNQLDTSMMRRDIPDETVIAHKTGELDGLAHEAGIVYHEKGDYLFVVLIWDAVSNHDARQAIGQVSKIVYDYFITSGGNSL